MPTIDQYQNDSYFRLLLQGEPGSGKSTTACGFPDAWVIDIDVNLDGPINYRKNHKLALPLGYDRIDRDDEGKILVGAAQYNQLDKVLLRIQQNPAIKTIIIDSATGLSDVILNETKRKNPGVDHGKQIYGFFLTEGKGLMSILSRIQKNVVLIAHERIEEDPMTQRVDAKGNRFGGNFQYRLVWPGQLGDYMGAFFKNVWRAEVHDGPGYPPVKQYKLRTNQDIQHPGLKNDMELPTLWEFSWDDILKRRNVTQ